MTDNEKTLHITEMERDAIGEIGNICMSAAATTLHDILQMRVTITTPAVEITNIKELASKYTTPYVVVDVSYTSGVVGNNLLVIKTDDVKLITSTMMGSEPNMEDELGELHLSAIGEVMNQMIGTSATSMSTLIKTPIGISPPTVSVINISEDRENLPLQEDVIISTTFKMEIENLLDTEIVLLMPYDFGKNLVTGFLEASNIENPPSKSQKEKQTPEVRSVTLQSFDDEPATGEPTDNLELLMDVPLMVSVELGRTKRILKDILELNIGSIVSLDKPAGDLVDVLVNGKVIARGEVVVIDDNFGVRITDIVGPDKRYTAGK